MLHWVRVFDFDDWDMGMDTLDTRVHPILVQIVSNPITCCILCATKVWCCNLIICYLTVQYTYAGVASFRIKCFPLLETTPTYICGLELKIHAKFAYFIASSFIFLLTRSYLSILNYINGEFLWFSWVLARMITAELKSWITFFCTGLPMIISNRSSTFQTVSPTHLASNTHYQHWCNFFVRLKQKKRI